jgi:NADP-dependent alcohol dehydrogenase
VVDAYTHVMEQYLIYPHEGYLQDRIAEGILQTLRVGQSCGKPKDYALASNFMWSCTMAERFNTKRRPNDWQRT